LTSDLESALQQLSNQVSAQNPSAEGSEQPSNNGSGNGSGNLVLAPNAGIAGDVSPNTLTGTDGADLISGGAGPDTIKALGGNDLVFALEGNDIVNLGTGDDTITAVAGNDTVNGDVGNDLVVGGVGDDDIKGGTGEDTMIGLDGADRFHFRTPQQGIDFLVDFDPVDTIQVSAQGFGGGLTQGAIKPEQFSNNGEVTAETRFIHDVLGGMLSFDADGSGGGEPIQFARLFPGVQLTNEDIVAGTKPNPNLKDSDA
jgi:Ca2+-binding RTX toxin-like protein